MNSTRELEDKIRIPLTFPALHTFPKSSKIECWILDFSYLQKNEKLLH